MQLESHFYIPLSDVGRRLFLFVAVVVIAVLLEELLWDFPFIVGWG